MIDILAFGAHPDDIEFGCGGILAKAAADGYKVLFADLTLGEKGTNGTPAIREKEAKEAAQVIGAERLFLGFTDCEIMDTYEGRLKLVKVIRTHKPRLVIAPFWKGEMNHPDHLACGTMVRHACRYARFGKILPELPTHQVEGVLHYLPHSVDETDILIDVSAHIDVWKQMMDKHQSQMKTYPYSDWVLKGAARLGTLSGVAYAQGLAAGNPIVVDDVMTVSHGTREI
jgi:bacillithiol biosynthesis deacetylase BshB1